MRHCADEKLRQEINLDREFDTASLGATIAPDFQSFNKGSFYGARTSSIDRYSMFGHDIAVIDGSQCVDDQTIVRFASTPSQLNDYYDIRSEFELLKGRHAQKGEYEFDKYDEDERTVPLLMYKRGENTPFAATRLLHGEDLPTLQNSGQAQQILESVRRQNGSLSYIYEQSRLYSSPHRARDHGVSRKYPAFNMMCLSSLILGNPERLDDAYMLVSGSPKHIIRGENLGLSSCFRGEMFDLNCSNNMPWYDQKRPVLMSLNKCIQNARKPSLLDKFRDFYDALHMAIAEQDGEVLLEQTGNATRVYDLSGYFKGSHAGNCFIKHGSTPLDVGASSEITKTLACRVSKRDFIAGLIK